jgi:thiosulfate reductase cytochrome b subunit
MAKRKVETVAGWRLPEPRITPMAIWLSVLWVGAPLLVVTGLLDLAMQVFFGVCTGVWCLVK